MNEPRTLHQYMELRNLQRKRENYLVNESKNFPNPLSLDKQRKIDLLIIQILDYIKHIVGEGPIFHRFRVMIQNLYKIFQRELTEFHNVGIANRFQNDQKYVEDMKKANSKLNQYLQKCEQEKRETDEKLEKLIKGNKQLNTNMLFINRNSPKKVEVTDNFEEDVGKPEKIVKIGKIDIGNNKKSISPNLILTPSKREERVEPASSRKPEQVKGKLSNIMASMFSKI